MTSSDLVLSSFFFLVGSDGPSAFYPFVQTTSPNLNPPPPAAPLPPSSASLACSPLPQALNHSLRCSFGMQSCGGFALIFWWLGDKRGPDCRPADPPTGGGGSHVCQEDSRAAAQTVSWPDCDLTRSKGLIVSVYVQVCVCVLLLFSSCSSFSYP